jgi:uncharacterized protein (TIGR02453 family)
MTAISKHTFAFLNDLKENNNREWFNANKERYETSKKEFEDFIDQLIHGIATFDNSIAHFTAKDCIFRIYRDVRFSKDKSPYKTHFGAHITSAPKKSEIHSRAGYYVQISPGDSFLGGGAYLPQSDWLQDIRQEISYHGDEFRAILSDPDFKKYFGEMEGEKLSKAPKGYLPDHPEIEFIKHKSFLGMSKCEDKLVTSASFLDHCTKAFHALYSFDIFLNRAMD